MKRKALNKSRSVYLNQNTPLNIVPEKKLKKAHTGPLMENKGKSRFRLKKIRERISALIKSEVVFRNKTNQLRQSNQNEKVKIHSQDLKQLVEGRGRKVSSYKARLLERNKLSLIYGNLGWRELRRCVLQSKHRKGVCSPSSGNKKTRPQTSSLPENLITLLESRLDVCVYRCRFFPSFYSCKQAINHGKVFVNRNLVKITGHLLKPGDLIQVVPRKTSFKQESNPFTKKGETKATPGFLGNLGNPRKEIKPYPHALEIEKQKTLLGLQNTCFAQVRSFWPSLPSPLLIRFHPSRLLPRKPRARTVWNGKQLNQENPRLGNADVDTNNACFAKKGNQLNLSLPCLLRTPLGGQHLSLEDKGEMEKVAVRETLPFREALFYTRQRGLFERRVVQNRLNLEEEKDLTFLAQNGKTVSFKGKGLKQGLGNPFADFAQIPALLAKSLFPSKASAEKLSSVALGNLGFPRKETKVSKVSRGSNGRVKSSNTLFLDFKEKKRILRDLCATTESRKKLNSVNTTLGTETSRVRVPKQNPTLFLRSQSGNGLGGDCKAHLVTPQGKERFKGANLAGLSRKGFVQAPYKGSREGFPSDLVTTRFRRLPKPLNLEISYQTLTAIFLYPPQRVNFPAHIDLEMIGKSV